MTTFRISGHDRASRNRRVVMFVTGDAADINAQVVRFPGISFNKVERCKPVPINLTNEPHDTRALPRIMKHVTHTQCVTCGGEFATWEKTKTRTCVKCTPVQLKLAI